MDAAIGELLSLDGKGALVTGGATGIGEGIARTLAAAGAHVTIGDIDVERAGKVAADIGGQAVEMDVTDPDAARAGVEAAGDLDVLVNNAGTYLGVAGSIIDQTYESWHRGVEVNLHSVFCCSKPAAEHMAERGGGAIVNIASVDGLLPCLGTSYDSAKAGVIHFTRSLAVDLAPMGIRVNALAPGHVPVDTLRRMHAGELPPLFEPSDTNTGLMGPLMRQRSQNIPMGRSALPEEIGHAALFLATRASAYVTGQTLAVDGGWTLV